MYNTFSFLVVAEAMERLLMTRYICEMKPTFSSTLREFALDPTSKVSSTVLQAAKEEANAYKSYQDKVRAGSLGKTAQFWMLYLDFIRFQHIIHTAIQVNDYDARLECWKYFVPFYFNFNKNNYARYGSYYVECMKSYDDKFPGLKNILKEKGFSVQSQERYPLRTAIDQRGEQTINRDAKTAGGIRNFASNEESVLKWCLNRSEQARNTRHLLDMCDLGNDSSIYKQCRPSQITKSEEMVKKVINVLKEEYIDPFGINVEKERLINISSGVPLPSESEEYLLKSEERGREQHSNFVKERILTDEVLFHSPIKRNKLLNFQTNSFKQSKAKNKSTEVNRDILSMLLSLSVRKQKVIDFQTALSYPLSQVPLSLCNADGSMRKTVKSKLVQCILSRANDEET
ncbi:MAG: hypothetical protein AAF391_08310 [Bacteroidota bacterium]